MNPGPDLDVMVRLTLLALALVVLLLAPSGARATPGGTAEAPFPAP